MRVLLQQLDQPERRLGRPAGAVLPALHGLRGDIQEPCKHVLGHLVVEPDAGDVLGPNLGRSVREFERCGLEGDLALGVADRLLQTFPDLVGDGSRFGVSFMMSS